MSAHNLVDVLRAALSSDEQQRKAAEEALQAVRSVMCRLYSNIYLNECAIMSASIKCALLKGWSQSWWIESGLLELNALVSTVWKI